MGLDSFSSDDSGTDEPKEDSTDDNNEVDTSTQQDEVHTSLGEVDMNFYGTGDGEPGTRPMERKGAMSNHSVSDLMESASDEISFYNDMVKLHLPIFTTITAGKVREQGERYILKHTKDKPKASWHNKVVACLGVVETRLGNMNKEVAMFNTGSVSKREVMEKLEVNLGEDINADTTIYINFLADAFMLRDLAQADQTFREGDLVNRDEVVSKVLNAKQLRVAVEQREEEDDS